MADDVEALKREVEALRAQLQRERERSKASDAAREEGDGGATRPPDNEAASASALASGERSRRPVQQELQAHVQHAPVGTKRGKWWLKDRRVLSQSAAASEEACRALKVRETWLWSGRTLVLDKIVVLPSEQHSEREGVDQEDGKQEDFDPGETPNYGLDVAAEATPANRAVVSDESTAPTFEAAPEFEPTQAHKDDSGEVHLDGEEPVGLAAERSPEEAEAPDATSKAEDEVREGVPPLELPSAQEAHEQD